MHQVLLLDVHAEYVQIFKQLHIYVLLKSLNL